MRRAILAASAILTCLLAGFSGGIVATAYHAAPAPAAAVPEILRTKRVEILNEQGKVAAVLSANSLDLLGRDGRMRATLRLEYNDKGILGFSDDTWEGRAIFGFLGTDTPSPKDDDWGLQIFSHETHDPVISLFTTENGRRGRFFLHRP